MNQFRSLYGNPGDARFVRADDLSVGDVVQWLETISMPMLGEVTSVRAKGRFIIVEVKHADWMKPGKLVLKRFSLATGTMVLTRTNALVKPREPAENVAPVAMYVRRSRAEQ